MITGTVVSSTVVVGGTVWTGDGTAVGTAVVVAGEPTSIVQPAIQTAATRSTATRTTVFSLDIIGRQGLLFHPDNCYGLSMSGLRLMPEEYAFLQA